MYVKSVQCRAGLSQAVPQRTVVAVCENGIFDELARELPTFAHGTEETQVCITPLAAVCRPKRRMRGKCSPHRLDVHGAYVT